MADVKISELTELSETPNASDVLPIVDVSASTTKKLTFTNLFSYLSGAISTVLTSNLTASRAVVSGSGGKLEASSVTSTEIAHLSGQTDYTNTRPVVNLLYNGNFDLWDKGTSPTDTDDTYILPGINWGESGSSWTISQQTSSPPEGSRYYLRVTGSTAGGDIFGIMFFLEAQDAIPLRGKAVSLSAKIKCAETTIKAAIASWDGAANAITSDIVSLWSTNLTYAANWTEEGQNSVSAGADWQTLKVENVTLDTSGMNNVAVIIWLTGNPGSTTLDIAQVQLEIGTKATQFVPRPVSLERYLAARRYLRMTGDASGNGPAIAGVATAGSQVFRNFIPFPVEMRVAPTATVGGTWAVTNCGQPTLSKTSVHGSCLTVVSSASGVFSAETNSASGDYLEFDAEL